MQETASSLMDTASMTGSVDARLVQFIRLLRDNGFDVSARDGADALRILSNGNALDRHVFRKTLQILFCTSPMDIARYHEIFDAYWLGHISSKRTLMRQMARAPQSSVKHSEAGGPASAKGLARYFEWRAENATGPDDGDAPAPGDQGDTRLGGASDITSRKTANLGQTIDPEEREQMLALTRRLGRRLRYTLSRRRKSGHRGSQLHMRRILGRSMQTGGLPVQLYHKIRKRPPVSLLLFVDVSGSMQSWSVFFTQFMHALTGSFARTEAFLFHTGLVHVSRALRDADPLVMMQKMSLIGQGWSGGTRIGATLETFNTQYGRDFTGSRTIAIIMSDGFDTGAPEILERELNKLKSRCKSLVWLNPLLGKASYEPTSRGAQIISRTVNISAPAHNLRSLLLLEDLLAHA